MGHVPDVITDDVLNALCKEVNPRILPISDFCLALGLTLSDSGFYELNHVMDTKSAYMAALQRYVLQEGRGSEAVTILWTRLCEHGCKQIADVLRTRCPEVRLGEITHFTAATSNLINEISRALKAQGRKDYEAYSTLLSIENLAGHDGNVMTKLLQNRLHQIKSEGENITFDMKRTLSENAKDLVAGYDKSAEGKELGRVMTVRWFPRVTAIINYILGILIFTVRFQKDTVMAVAGWKSYKVDQEGYVYASNKEIQLSNRTRGIYSSEYDTMSLILLILTTLLASTCMILGVSAWIVLGPIICLLMVWCERMPIYCTHSTMVKKVTDTPKSLNSDKLFVNLVFAIASFGFLIWKDIGLLTCELTVVWSLVGIFLGLWTTKERIFGPFADACTRFMPLLCFALLNADLMPMHKKNALYLFMAACSMHIVSQNSTKITSSKGIMLSNLLCAGQSLFMIMKSTESYAPIVIYALYHLEITTCVKWAWSNTGRLGNPLNLLRGILIVPFLILKALLSSTTVVYEHGIKKVEFQFLENLILETNRVRNNFDDFMTHLPLVMMTNVCMHTLNYLNDCAYQTWDERVVCCEARPLTGMVKLGSCILFSALSPVLAKAIVDTGCYDLCNKIMGTSHFVQADASWNFHKIKLMLSRVERTLKLHITNAHNIQSTSLFKWTYDKNAAVKEWYNRDFTTLETRTDFEKRKNDLVGYEPIHKKITELRDMSATEDQTKSEEYQRLVKDFREPLKFICGKIGVVVPTDVASREVDVRAEDRLDFLKLIELLSEEIENKNQNRPNAPPRRAARRPEDRPIHFGKPQIFVDLHVTPSVNGFIPPPMLEVNMPDKIGDISQWYLAGLMHHNASEAARRLWPSGVTSESAIEVLQKAKTDLEAALKKGKDLRAKYTKITKDYEEKKLTNDQAAGRKLKLRKDNVTFFMAMATNAEDFAMYVESYEWAIKQLDKGILNVPITSANGEGALGGNDPILKSNYASHARVVAFVVTLNRSQRGNDDEYDIPTEFMCTLAPQIAAILSSAAGKGKIEELIAGAHTDPRVKKYLKFVNEWEGKSYKHSAFVVPNYARSLARCSCFAHTVSSFAFTNPGVPTLTRTKFVAAWYRDWKNAGLSETEQIANAKAYKSTLYAILWFVHQTLKGHNNQTYDGFIEFNATKVTLNVISDGSQGSGSNDSGNASGSNQDGYGAGGSGLDL